MTRVEKIFPSLKGLFGLLTSWVMAIIANMRDIQETAQLAATVAAVIASLITARYYWKKTESLDNEKARRNHPD